MLKTETNTTAMSIRIHRAAYKKGLLGIGTHFEHGQWWVIKHDTGAAWSVVDAEGGTSEDGFDFEQVSEGEDAS